MNKAHTIKDPAIEPYYIEYDGLNYTLCSDEVSVKGREHKVIHGFYSTLAGALLKASKLLTEDNYDSIQAYIDKLQEIKEQVFRITNDVRL